MEHQVEDPSESWLSSLPCDPYHHTPGSLPEFASSFLLHSTLGKLWCQIPWHSTLYHSSPQNTFRHSLLAFKATHHLKGLSFQLPFLQHPLPAHFHALGHSPPSWLFYLSCSPSKAFPFYTDPSKTIQWGKPGANRYILHNFICMNFSKQAKLVYVLEVNSGYLWERGCWLGGTSCWGAGNDLGGIYMRVYKCDNSSNCPQQISIIYVS